jgi:hypothetical protein
MMKKREDAIVVVIDVQQRLLPVIDGHEDVCRGVEKLLEGMAILGVPSLVTEQYPDALGGTVASVKSLIEANPIPKLSFSCCGVEEFNNTLKASRRRHVVVVGVETHVCVYQTVRDLLDYGYEVSVVTDAVGSRTSVNKEAALNRMQALGANLVTTEMILFDFLERAEGPDFKAVLKVVK